MVCAEWRNDYLAFLAHIGPKPTPDHSVDRIDNDRGYEPGNVRWATRSEQMQNTRHNVNITHDGETFCAAEWARRTGIDKTTLLARIHRGVPTERAFDPRPIGRYEMRPRMRAASSRQPFTDG